MRLQGASIAPSEITSPDLYRGRRQWLAAALGGVAGTLLPSAQAAGDMVTPPDQATRYNNYLEFSSAKDAVWQLAADFSVQPWTLRVDGEVRRPRTWSLETLLHHSANQERIERMRCVEGWSMVVPWSGIPLGELLRQAEPGSRARYVEFTCVDRPSQMPGQRRPGLAWPYVEGLRIDEAMHPLTLLAHGLYGEPLPVQNGAPLRLVVPWKYGFKSPKAIVRIRLTDHMPVGSWQRAAPSEYGFWGNVDPAVDHPRWSQSRETRLGEWRKRPTLPFNGYAAEVAHLYQGLDPRTLY